MWCMIYFILGRHMFDALTGDGAHDVARVYNGMQVPFNNSMDQWYIIITCT